RGLGEPRSCSTCGGEHPTRADCAKRSEIHRLAQLGLEFLVVDSRAGGQNFVDLVRAAEVEVDGLDVGLDGMVTPSPSAVVLRCQPEGRVDSAANREVLGKGMDVVEAGYDCVLTGVLARTTTDRLREYIARTVQLG